MSKDTQTNKKITKRINKILKNHKAKFSMQNIIKSNFTYCLIGANYEKARKQKNKKQKKIFTCTKSRSFHKRLRFFIFKVLKKCDGYI